MKPLIPSNTTPATFADAMMAVLDIDAATFTDPALFAAALEGRDLEAVIAGVVELLTMPAPEASK
jgi:hypothetical protein